MPPQLSEFSDVLRGYLKDCSGDLEDMTEKGVFKKVSVIRN